jgi:hypothetical protein
MSDLDNLIAGFKDNMAKTAEFVTGNDTHDVQTPTGPVPSLAKIAKQAGEAVTALLPDISNRLRIDQDANYDPTLQAYGRKNLGLDKVANLEPAKLPVSEAVQAALEVLATDIGTRERTANKGKSGGYAALVGTKLAIPNSNETLNSFFYHTNTVARNWQMQDQDGIVALKSDITGNNTNTNTGDETQSTILQKLGLAAISGANTGDETNTTILQKLGLTEISGVNTGDETADTIIGKIGAPLLIGARGAIDGVAPLGSDRLIPAQYLPTAFKSVEVLNTLADIPVTGVLERLYIVVENTGLYYYNQVSFVQLNTALQDTDQLTEGTNRLYFTTLRVLQTALTGLDTSDPSQVAAVDSMLIAIGKLQAQVSARELLANKAVDFSVINDVRYPTTKAVKTYLDTRLVSVVNDRGSWDASGNTWPTTGGSKEDGSIKKGDLWYVGVAGQLGGVAVNVGDSFRAMVDSPGTTATNWNILESNLGYVPYNATNPLNFTSNQTDAYLLSRANHTGTQSADTITDSATRVMVSPAEKAAITHANRAALDLVSGTNTGDETQASIFSKISYTPANQATVLLKDGSVAMTGALSTVGLNVSPVAGTGTGVAIIINGQSVAAGSTGVGGAINLTAGDANTIGNGQIGGAINITAGKGASGTGPGPTSRGGNITIRAGQGGTPSAGSAQAGTVAIFGADGLATGGTGGSASIAGGASPTAIGGTAGMSGGQGATQGGPALINGGIPNSTTGAGGPVTITAANGGSASGDGGSVTITAGVAAAGSNPGKVLINSPGGVEIDTTLKVGGAVQSGTNTGDETQAGILGKLGATTVTGSNTGDETTATIKTKLGIATLSGANTGDETQATILTKLGATTVTGSNTGDETTATIQTKLNGQTIAPSTINATGNVNVTSAAPTVQLVESDQAGTGGVWRMVADGNVLRMDMNTAAARDMSTYVTPLQILATGVVSITQGLSAITAANAAGAGQNMFLRAGAGSTSGGTAQLSAGAGTGANAAGGNLSLQAGAGTGTAAGGSVIIAAGTTGSGTAGQVNITAPGGMTVDTTLKVAGVAVESTANKAIDFSVVNDTWYPSVKAVKSYVDATLVGVLNDRGTYDASVNTYPTTGGSGTAGAIRKGDFWYVGTAGTLGGVAVNVGDSFRALIDAPGQTTTNWAQLESNIGYVPVNKAGDSMGTLTITTGIFNIQAAAGASKNVNFTTAGSVRWAAGANNTAESGTNAGSDFGISRYSDAGTYIDTPFAITRSTGAAAFSVSINTPILTSNAGLDIKTTGANSLNLWVNGAKQVEVASVASAVNRVRLRGGATGSGVTVDAVGTDTDVSLTLAGQGAGTVAIASVMALSAGVQTTELDKGSVGTGTVTFSAKASGIQKLTVTGALTIATSGWPAAGTHADMLIELVNGGSAAVTMSGISWILPTTGAPAASFSAYLTAIGRSPASLQSAGTDWIYLWSTNGGTTINGKLV